MVSVTNILYTMYTEMVWFFKFAFVLTSNFGSYTSAYSFASDDITLQDWLRSYFWIDLFKKRLLLLVWL